jgi:glutathione S-transferase
MADHDLHLISFESCPYVERSRITLEEKGVDYDLTFIDLGDKPDWFLDISPRGKVPVLKVDDEPIFESAVINELLDELYPDPPMFPEDPIERAKARAWIVYNEGEIMGPSYMLMVGNDVEEQREQLRGAFEKVDATLAERDGTYFLGDDFGLVDAVYAPLFNRWEAMTELGHDDLLDGLDHLSSYGNALLERESVQAARYEDLTEAVLAYGD